MTWFTIRPRDVWLFRDGRPFNAGEDNSARSLFPPTPLTVQGALRQKISESNGLSFHEYRKGTSGDAKRVGDYIGTYDEQKEKLTTGAFEMNGPFLSVQTHENRVMPLFSCPADFLVAQNDSGGYVDSLISAPRTEVTVSDLDTENTSYQFLDVQDNYENLPSHWMTGQAFAMYLNRKSVPTTMFFQPEHAISPESKAKRPVNAQQAIQKEKHILPAELVYKHENRFGVSTNSETSFRDEGMLYQTQYVRPTDGVSLLVDVTGQHDDTHVIGDMTIGGEQRQAQNASVKVIHFPERPATLTGHFKVIFLTPAYFKQGWLPDTTWKIFFDVDVELRGAALYHPQRIGGWNNAAGKNGGQRTMHNYVAPGSVYYFHTAESFQPPATLTETPAGMANAAHIGFGQVAYTTWNP